MQKVPDPRRKTEGADFIPVLIEFHIRVERRRFGGQRCSGGEMACWNESALKRAFAWDAEQEETDVEHSHVPSDHPPPPGRAGTPEAGKWAAEPRKTHWSHREQC